MYVPIRLRFRGLAFPHVYHASGEKGVPTMRIAGWFLTWRPAASDIPYDIQPAVHLHLHGEHSPGNWTGYRTSSQAQYFLRSAFRKLRRHRRRQHSDWDIRSATMTERPVVAKRTGFLGRISSQLAEMPIDRRARPRRWRSIQTPVPRST